VPDGSVAIAQENGNCPVPDGSVAIAQENGTILLLDPATDQREVIARDLGTIETVVWDARNNRLLATDDHDGRLLAFTPSKPFDTRSDLLEFAPYHPIYSPQYIPRHCPKYLADVLALGGAPFNSERFTNLSFRAFTRRVPLIAADARAIPIGDADRQEDPIERVQFVVFEPNQISLNKKGLSMPLAAFVVRTRSGKLTRTSLMHTTGQRADAVAGQVDSVGDTAIVVPQPAAISVSVLGMATLHFMGLGQTPDFAIAIDPRNPSESYMVVFTPDDRRWHYRLELPGPGEQSDQWIIAYRGLRPDEWTRLSRPPSAPAAPEEHAFTVQ
jgi:hypothetical protein